GLPSARARPRRKSPRLARTGPLSGAEQGVAATPERPRRSFGIILVVHFMTMHSDAPLGPLVDVELKDIGPGIVSDNIEAEFAARDLAEIDFGHEDRFIVRVRPGDEVAERIDDATPTASDYSFRLIVEGRGVLGGKIPTSIELIRGQYETTALDGNVAHR